MTNLTKTFNNVKLRVSWTQSSNIANIVSGPSESLSESLGKIAKWFDTYKTNWKTTYSLNESNVNGYVKFTTTIDGEEESYDVKIHGLESAAFHQHSEYAPATHSHNYAGSDSAGGPANEVKGEASSSDASSHVWFSNNTTETLRSYDDDFKYNPATNTLTVGSITGSASKLSTDAGSSIKPVYFSNGIPVACSHTIETDVPQNAVFTDQRVNQGYSMVNRNYPLLFSSQDGITSTSSRGNIGALLNNQIYANPYYGSLKFNEWTAIDISTETVDLNNLKPSSSGGYRRYVSIIGTNKSNLPSAYTGGYFVLETYGMNNVMVKQVIQFELQSIYVRVYANSEWSAWQECKYTDTTYTLSGEYGTGNTTWITTLKTSSSPVITVGTSTVPTATTSAYGITKLTDSTSSTSITTAATPNSVKSAYDLANSKSAVSYTPTETEGSIIGTLTINGTQNVLYYNPGSGSDTKVTQTQSDAENHYYELLFSKSPTTDPTTKTEEARKSCRLTFNPYSSRLIVENINTNIPIKIGDNGDWISYNTEDGITFTSERLLQSHEHTHVMSVNSSASFDTDLATGEYRFLNTVDSFLSGYLPTADDDDDNNGMIYFKRKEGNNLSQLAFNDAGQIWYRSSNSAELQPNSWKEVHAYPYYQGNVNGSSTGTTYGWYRIYTMPSDVEYSVQIEVASVESREICRFSIMSEYADTFSVKQDMYHDLDSIHAIPWIPKMRIVWPKKTGAYRYKYIDLYIYHSHPRHTIAYKILSFTADVITENVIDNHLEYIPSFDTDTYNSTEYNFGEPVGSATRPIYLDKYQIPQQISYTIESNVPSNAKFTDTTYTAGSGLALSGTTFNHSNLVTAVTTEGLKKITYDAQGHITGSSAIDASDLPSHTHPYLPLAGGTMDAGKNITLPSVSSGKNGRIIQHQRDESNYTQFVEWYKNGQSQAEYNPQIGQHNTGGTAQTGAIVLLPYATENQPWLGNDGLYITETNLKFNGTEVSLNGHTHAEFKLQRDGNAVWTYNGSEEKILNIKAGSNMSITNSGGTITFNATNTDTDTKVTQTQDDTSASDYEVLFAGSTSASNITEGARKSSGMKYKPSTKELTLSGNIYIKTATTSAVRLTNDSGYTFGLHIGSSGINRGVYDFTSSKWICYVDSNNKMHLGQDTVGSTSTPIYLNGGIPEVCTSITATGFTNKTLTKDTIDNTSGSFTFEGNNLIGNTFDWVGLQVDSSSSVDRWQLTGDGTRLLFRQNDTTGAPVSGWTAWSSLLKPSDVNVSGGLNRTINTITIGSGDTAATYNTGVTIGLPDWDLGNTTLNSKLYDASMNDGQRANRFAGVKAGQVVVERSSNSGSSWTTDSSVTRNEIFTNDYYPIGIVTSTAAGAATAACQLRITIDCKTANIYSAIKKIHLLISTNYSTNCRVTITGSTVGSPDTYDQTLVTSQPLSGWSGWNVINIDKTVGGNGSTNIAKLRFLFTTDGLSDTSVTSSGLKINRICAYGGVGWNTVSNLAKYDRPYKVYSDMCTDFPNSIIVNSVGTTDQTYGQFRACATKSDNTSYGFMIRNDGTASYLLLTDANNQYGSANTYRPLKIDNATGVLQVNSIKAPDSTSEETNYAVMLASSPANYGPTTSGLTSIYKNNNFRYKFKTGTASAEGYDFIILGNQIGTGTAGNSTGRIALYSPGATYAATIVPTTLTAGRTITLPNASGTVSLEGHTHNYAGSASPGGPANSVKTAFTLQNNGDNIWTYDGSTARTLNFVAGSNMTITNSGGTITFASTNTNTDTLVKQTVDATATAFPILTRASATATSGTAGEAKYVAGVTITPSTKTITATTFSGNATSASKLTTNTAGSASSPVYFNNGIPVACTSISANEFKNKTLTKDTIDNTAGSFTFEGNYLIGNVYDWVGLQVDYLNSSSASVDKWQLTGDGSRLLFRQNDGDGWTTWSSLLKPSDVNVSGGLTRDINTITIGSGDTAATYNIGVTISHTNSVTAVPDVGLLKVKYDAQGHITGSTAVVKSDITALGIPGSDTNTTYSLSGVLNSSNQYVVTLTPSSGNTSTATIGVASTSAYGITKLSSATNSTSTALAATASAVKSAYDLANKKSEVSFTQSLTSGTAIGKITIDGTETTLYCQTNTNTDTLVKQTADTSTTAFPILIRANASAASATAGEAKYVAGVTITPSTKTITATTFAGRTVNAAGGSWIQTRDRVTAYNNYVNTTSGNAVACAASKSKLGVWAISTLSINDNLYFAYTTDEDYASGTNVVTSYTINTDGLFSGSSSKVQVTSALSLGAAYDLPLVPQITTAGTSNQALTVSNNYIRLTSVAGTTSAGGNATLILGNGAETGTANNALGQILLYSSSSYGVYITPAQQTSAHHTLTLPNASGTVALMDSTEITVQTGSEAKQRISFQTFMTWMITTKKYIPSGVRCTRSFQIKFQYATNDIMQFTIQGRNFEMDLAGCVIEFDGYATAYDTGVFRVRIHSSPARSLGTSTTPLTSGYAAFPLAYIAEYTCNGSAYAPTWSIVNNDMQQISGLSYWGMNTPEGTAKWVRTTTLGLIPYYANTGVPSGSSNSSIGTSSMTFQSAYINKIYAKRFAGYLIRSDGVEGTSSRESTLNITPTNMAGVRFILSTSSISAANGYPGDGYTLHFEWDNGSELSSQFWVPNSTSRPLKWRARSSSGWGDWIDVMDDRMMMHSIKSSAALSTKQYYRVATIPASIAAWNAQLLICTSYNNTPCTHIVSISFNGTTHDFKTIHSSGNMDVIPDIRIVHHATAGSIRSNQQHIEINYQASASNYVRAKIISFTGIEVVVKPTMVAFTAGAIPSGFTSTVFKIGNNLSGSLLYSSASGSSSLTVTGLSCKPYNAIRVDAEINGKRLIYTYPVIQSDSFRVMAANGDFTSTSTAVTHWGLGVEVSTSYTKYAFAGSSETTGKAIKIYNIWGI